MALDRASMNCTWTPEQVDARRWPRRARTIELDRAERGASLDMGDLLAPSSNSVAPDAVVW
jgi:hypothetical protein